MRVVYTETYLDTESDELPRSRRMASVLCTAVHMLTVRGIRTAEEEDHVQCITSRHRRQTDSETESRACRHLSSILATRRQAYRQTDRQTPRKHGLPAPLSPPLVSSETQRAKCFRPLDLTTRGVGPRAAWPQPLHFTAAALHQAAALEYSLHCTGRSIVPGACIGPIPCTVPAA
jgi:hypothetical protein